MKSRLKTESRLCTFLRERSHFLKTSCKNQDKLTVVPPFLGCSLWHLSPNRQCPLKKNEHTVFFLAEKEMITIVTPSVTSTITQTMQYILLFSLCYIFCIQMLGTILTLVTDGKHKCSLF